MSGPGLGTTVQLMRWAAARYGDAAAIVDRGDSGEGADGGRGETVLTFAALPGQVMRVARGLIALGARPGDRVGLWAQNGWEWIVAALGVQAAGGVLLPINTRFKGDEAAYLLRRSGARLLLCTAGFLGIDYVALLKGAAEPPALDATVILRGEVGAAPAGTLTLDGLCRLGETVPQAEAERRAQAVRPGDLSDMLFTSGTTGRPKGVLCTHEQTVRAFHAWGERVGLRPGDRYLAALPFFHSFGYKAGWLAALMAGATLLPHAIFDAERILRRIPRERISVLPGPPALYQTLLALPERSRHDLSSLRLAVTGASMVPVELVERMRGELGFQTVLTGYGLTEATGVTTLCSPDDDARTVALTSGRPIPGVEVEVVDDAGRAVPVGEPGEVLVRGYTVMSGYYDDPAATAEVIVTEGGQRSLRTGDIGVLDDRGYLRITDRKKDLFIVGGFNVYPAEVEAVLLQHPDVLQVAVVGVPDERLGEVGRAYLVPRPGVAPQQVGAALGAYCRERMANYKVPRGFELLAELPRNASGKVLKYQLREQAKG